MIRASIAQLAVRYEKERSKKMEDDAAAAEDKKSTKSKGPKSLD